VSRALRIEFPGAWYHVMDRGVEKRAIFIDDWDRSHFLDLLSLSRERFGTIVHAYCLMDNHYHLLLETPSSNLSQAIHLINAGYTTWFNKRHDRVGTLFQGRFKALLVERDVYALSASRYVHRNAVCAGFCREPSSYIWSSSRSYAGLQRAAAFLETGTVLSLAGGAAQYREYLGSAEDDERELEKDTIAGTILGSPSFADRVVALQGTSIFAKRSGMCRPCEL
jgi:putative transposase